MPGGRRNITFRASAARHNADHEAKKQPSSQQQHEDSPINPGTTGVVRHLPLPAVPRLSVFGFELVMWVFCLMVIAAQYLNIYRTVFWLPHSHTKYAMNLYLIEPKVLAFIVLSISRRLIWCVVKTLVTASLPHSHWKAVVPIARVLVFLVLGMTLVYCITTIHETLTYMKLILLAYPFLMYLFLFDFGLSCFLEVIPPALHYRETEGNRAKTAVARLLQHNCLNSSEGVRNEAEFLSSHCNKRLILACYHSAVNVYYITFVPCIFAPNGLHFDHKWIIIHTMFVAVTCFLWHLLYCFPARFCDIVHRSVEHLGLWVLSYSNSSNACVWQSSQLYSKGALVRHGRDIYKASATCNASEPGNDVHAGLYKRFHEVYLIFMYVLLATLLCSLGYLGYLVTLTHWHQVLATGLLLGSQYAALYVLLRDYMVLKTTYKMEQQ